MGAEAISLSIVVTVRERFSLAAPALAALYENTPGPFNLIYVIGGGPKTVRCWLEREASKRGFDLIQHSWFLTPNESRNIGLSRVNSDYVVFIENDVIPAPGWLEALVTHAQDTGAAVLAPLICEGPTLHRVVHQAGGTFAVDPKHFFGTAFGERKVSDNHTFQGRSIDAIGRAPTEVQTGEFHCVMVRTDVMHRLGGFDEQMMSTREHLDFAMSIYQLGERVVLVPSSIVTFHPPWVGKCLEGSDMHYHMVRWSARWGRVSTERFRLKWGIHPEQTHNSFVSWRYSDDIVKPYLRKLPLIGRSRFFRSAAARLVRPLLLRIGDVLSARADARRGKAGVGRLAVTVVEPGRARTSWPKPERQEHSARGRAAA